MKTHAFRRSWPLLGVGALAAVLAAGCGHGQPAGRASKRPEVVVSTPVTGVVTDYQDFTGRLSARKAAEIRARVSGYVQKAAFKEGARVRQGDVLFEIDPVVYEAAYEKAVADVAQYEAQKRLMDATYARDRQLVGRGISQEDLDKTVALRDQAVANIAAARAQVKTARQNLDWTRVTAPFAGRVSRRLVDPGNLVKADDTLLTTLVTEDPMYVYFDVDERTYMDLVGSSSGVTAWKSGRKVPVLMRLANEEQFGPAKGELFSHAGFVDFVDNQVNGTTGTIRLRGVFANPKGVLKPGLFARVRLPLSMPHSAVLVAGEALQHDQGRQCVYVLNDKDEVVYRRVTLGQELQGLREIKDGLSAGERVIVSGMLQVRPGVQVRAKMQAPPPPPVSPLGRLLAFDPNRETGRQGDKETRRQGG